MKAWLQASLLVAFAARAEVPDAGPVPIAPADAGVVTFSPADAGAAAEERPLRLTLPGLPNLARVAPGIYRGGRPLLAEGGAESLQQLHIAKVINLQGGDLTSSMQKWTDWPTLLLRMEPGEALGAIVAEGEAMKKIGAEMIHTPLDSLDPIDAREAGELRQILDLLDAADEAHPIYVHCEHGKDRTGLVLALYRVRHDGWSPARAAAEMADLGHVGRLDEYFTGNMDISRVLALFPALAQRPR